MATTPTNLPVTSESPIDLKFNAGKIDEFVTSFAQQYIDRFGNAHYTIEGLKQLVLQQIYNLGWNPVGSFQDGASVTAAGDIVQDESTGIWYRWDDLSTIPKSVPAGSTPGSTGGVGEGKWLAVDVSDVLRKDLASPEGATLVYNGSETVADQLNRLLKSELGVFHVDNYGAIGNGIITGIGTAGNVISGTSDTAAIQAAINAAEAAGGGVIKFTPYKSYRLTYSLLFGSNLIFDFQGARIIWDCPATADEASFLLGKYYNIGNDTDYSDNVIIRNLRLATGYLRGNGIGLPKCRNILIQNVRTEYCYLHTVDATGTKNCVIERVYADSASTLAHIQIDVATGQKSVSGADSSGNYLYCSFDATGSATWSYADNCFIRYCYVTNSLYAGIHIHNSGARRIYIDNCYVASNQRGIHTDDNGYVISMWITNSTIRNNNTYELYLQASHREIYVDKCVIGNDARATGATLELVTMRGSAVDLAKRLSVSFTNNKFSGRARGPAIQYYQNVIYKGNEHRAMGDTMTLSAVSDAVSYGANFFNCNNLVDEGNVFYDCIVDACLVHNGGSHHVISSNKAQGSGSLCKAFNVVNLVTTGNEEAPLAAALCGSYLGTCTRATISTHQALMSAARPAIYFNGGTILYATNCSTDSTDTAGVGIAAAGGASLRTSCNNIRTVTKAIETSGATSITCHEPFIAAANIVNSGTGTITYNTFTTATK